MVTINIQMWQFLMFIAVTEVVNELGDMKQLENDNTWSHADDGFKAFYWNSMAQEEQRRYIYR